MDRFGAALERRLQYQIGIQITLRKRRGSESKRLIGRRDVRRRYVCVRKNRHARDVHPLERAKDPASDLPSVGHEHTLEHGPILLLAAQALSRSASRSRFFRTK